MSHDQKTEKNIFKKIQFFEIQQIFKTRKQLGTKNSSSAIFYFSMIGLKALTRFYFYLQVTIMELRMWSYRLPSSKVLIRQS